MSYEKSSLAKGSIRVKDIGKRYEIYANPRHRLKQFIYGSRKRLFEEFWALRGISFELEPGDSLGIIGRNGAGKSTLLQIIAGTLHPTRGIVESAGRVAALLELGAGFNFEFTGRENVYLNGTILGLTEQEIDDRFDEIAAFADIGEYIDQPIKTYSSGMIVRLAFAVQVQVEPDILIIDEALAVGDALFQKRCFQRMEALIAKGVTLVFVSHDIESVRTLTRRALLLEKGEQLMLAPSAEVVLEYRALLHEEEKRYFDTYIKHQQQKKQDQLATEAAAKPTKGRRTDKLSFGDMDAKIMEVIILNEKQEECTIFYPGELMRIRVKFFFDRDLTHTNIGLRIRNKQGVKVYSWGTLNQDMQIWAGLKQGEVFWDREFNKGDICAVEFRCLCNLGVNFYEVQAAISEERDRYYQDQRMIHWMDEAAFFQVTQRQKEYFFGGVCDMKMEVSMISYIENMGATE